MVRPRGEPTQLLSVRLKGGCHRSRGHRPRTVGHKETFRPVRANQNVGAPLSGRIGLGNPTTEGVTLGYDGAGRWPVNDG